MIDWAWDTRILVQQNRWLKPYLKIAYELAAKSNCQRRHYGCVIAFAGHNIAYVDGYNQQIYDCCNGICSREAKRAPHGEQIEEGACIHAEQAALIAWPAIPPEKVHTIWYVVLAGTDIEGKPLYGRDMWPCLDCARALRYAGFKYVYIEESENNLVPLPLDYVLEQ